MATCEVCGEEISGATLLECADCKEGFCRNHYHGHDCDPADEIAEGGGDGARADAGESEDSQEQNSSNILPQTGYLLSVIASGIGALYLLSGVDVVVSGGGLQELVSLVVAGSFFSLATFLLVGSYIADQ